jgi:hypothetical protein
MVLAWVEQAVVVAVLVDTNKCRHWSISSQRGNCRAQIEYLRHLDCTCILQQQYEYCLEASWDFRNRDDGMRRYWC